MAATIPSIACLCVIGRHNNPLHTAIFPSYDPTSADAHSHSRGHALVPARTPLQFSLVLSSTIDIFELRAKQHAGAGTGLSGDLGLLHAVDDRLAAYGFETNTGVRFIAVVDMCGRSLDSSAGNNGTAATSPGIGGAAGHGIGTVGLRDGELKPVFRAMQNAYVRLLQNPFYDPDDQVPARGRPGKKITSKRFASDVRRIGETWTPGLKNL